MKIWPGVGSAGALGSCSTGRGLMIGGGGSTAKRAAADVIIGVVRGVGAIAGAGRTGAPDEMVRGDRSARGAGAAIGRGGAPPVIGGAAPDSSSFSWIPLSTNWLIETPLVSQNALSRSYAFRLTLMLRRVCFFAMTRTIEIPSDSQLLLPSQFTGLRSTSTSSASRLPGAGVTS